MHAMLLDPGRPKLHLEPWCCLRFNILTRPDNHIYLSGLDRLRVITPTQWPTYSLCTLYLLRYLTDTTLGTGLLFRATLAGLGLALGQAAPARQRQLSLAYMHLILSDLNLKSTEVIEIPLWKAKSGKPSHLNRLQSVARVQRGSDYLFVKKSQLSLIMSQSNSVHDSVKQF
jgi:hypothetical protein